MVQWEYKVGPLTVNFRVLLEPKGFLRIVLLVSLAAVQQLLASPVLQWFGYLVLGGCRQCYMGFAARGASPVLQWFPGMCPEGILASGYA